MNFMNYEKKSTWKTQKTSSTKKGSSIEITCQCCLKEYQHTKATFKRCGNYCVACDLSAETRSDIRSKINNIKDAIYERRKQATDYVDRLFFEKVGRHPLSKRELLLFLESTLEELELNLEIEIQKCSYYARDEDVARLIDILSNHSDDILWKTQE